MSHSPDHDKPDGGWLRDLRLSFCFLTRLPVPQPILARPDAVGKAMRAFPLIGAGIGLATGTVLLLLHTLGLPPLPAALLAAAAGLFVTGALHEDGLADLADGLGGGRSREDALAIMRDSRIGAFGALALILAVGLKASALAALLGVEGGFAVALAVPTAAAAWSRAVLPALLHALPPARADGLSVMAGLPGRTAVWQALLIAWIICLVALWPYAPLLGLIGIPLAAMAGAAAVGWLADRRFGGQTGDVAGAAQVVSEILALLLCAAWLGA